MTVRKVLAVFFGVLAAIGLLTIASFPLAGGNWPAAMLAGMLLLLVSLPTAATLWDERAPWYAPLPIWMMVIGAALLLSGWPRLRAVGVFLLIGMLFVTASIPTGR